MIARDAAVVMRFLFDWRMGLLCLLTMVLAMLCVMSMMGGKNAGFFHRYQTEIERMSGEEVEYVRGIPVVKMFHHNAQIRVLQIVRNVFAITKG